jgi:hypothetical protein
MNSLAKQGQPAEPLKKDGNRKKRAIGGESGFLLTNRGGIAARKEGSAQERAELDDFT